MSNNSNTAPAEDSRWHRQPTVWVVLGILGFTFVSSFVLLYLAASNPPEIIDRAPVRIEAPNRG